MRGRTILICVAALLTVGCSAASRAPEPDPRRAVRAWHDALVEGRTADAWALLAPEAREGMDEGDFAALYARQKGALIEQARALLALAEAAEPEEGAEVEVFGEGRAELRRTPEGWRLTAPVEPPATPAPAEAQ